MFREKKCELYLTTDMKKFVEVQNKLEESHIPYQTDTGYSGMQNRMTGRFLGNIGQSGSHETIYYVYVSEENLAAAKEVVRRI